MNGQNFDNCSSHNNKQTSVLNIDFVTVTIFHMQKVLVCRRGVGGRDYGKIYSCGGAIDHEETPIDAAIRETYEEAGVKLTATDLIYYDTFEDRHNRRRNDYFVHMYGPLPNVEGPQSHCKWEMLKVEQILNVPTINQWSWVDVKELTNYFQNNPTEADSSFGRLFLKMKSKVFPSVRYVSVTIFYQDKVLVCRRGVRGNDYGKIYSCGGGIDHDELPVEAAIRETLEEAGVKLTIDDLTFFGTYHKKRNDYFVHFQNETPPEVMGPIPSCAWEMLDVKDILNVPTINRWSFVSIDELTNYFENDPNNEGDSAFARLFMQMKTTIVYK